MLRLSLTAGTLAAPRVLCLGAHADDIEIGCGGTILKLLEARRDLVVDWVVFSAPGDRRHEAVASANRLLAGAKSSKVHVKNFRTSYFPFTGHKIKDEFERLKRRISPEIIFTHYRGDLHQDHRLISSLTWNTFRDHMILEYEIPKYDGDLGRPNFFVELDEPTCSRKIRHVMECFRTQRGKQWFSEDTFWGLLRIRGIEANAKTKFAEAFYCRKMVF